MAKCINALQVRFGASFEWLLFESGCRLESRDCRAYWRREKHTLFYFTQNAWIMWRVDFNRWRWNPRLGLARSAQTTISHSLESAYLFRNYSVKLEPPLSPRLRRERSAVLEFAKFCLIRRFCESPAERIGYSLSGLEFYVLSWTEATSLLGTILAPE